MINRSWSRAGLDSHPILDPLGDSEILVLQDATVVEQPRTVPRNATSRDTPNVSTAASTVTSRVSAVAMQSKPILKLLFTRTALLAHILIL
mmetsp:Transcript_18060/g.31959  ORF Transcript_18060/g.31959 Transcript_18060/m.31959 type:complete len:91 (+) Transcript_18060:3703-3975(+)